MTGPVSYRRYGGDSDIFLATSVGKKGLEGHIGDDALVEKRKSGDACGTRRLLDG